MKYLAQPSGLAAPLGRYSHIAIEGGTGIVSIAGQVGITAEGELPGNGSISAQVEQAYQNLATALASVGAAATDVFKMTTYLTDADSIGAFMETRSKVFASMYPSADYPPNTLLIINRLVEARFLVEIEALAFLVGSD